MRFETLKDRMNYYRGLTDYKLMPRSYVMVMLDGRSFSHLIKNKFRKPFDGDFIEMMNETARYVCENVSGCKFAYVQSDEISLVLTDFDNDSTESFFGYRLTKMLSIIASLATGKFNQLMTLRLLGSIAESPNSVNIGVCKNAISSLKLAQFDCKCWNVPCYNDVFGWLLHRQIDCIRNSKAQTAQAYLPHKQLEKLNADQQIEKLKAEKGVDWHSFDDSLKFGRFIYKEDIMMTSPCENGTMEYMRHPWIIHPAFCLTNEDGRARFDALNIIPVM